MHRRESNLPHEIIQILITKLNYGIKAGNALATYDLRGQKPPASTNDRKALT